MAMATIFKKMLIGRAFSAEKGRIKMFGKMDWMLVPAKAMAEMFQEIAEKMGEEYLYGIGYNGGKSTADEMIKAMGLKPSGGWVTQKAMISLLDFLGYGEVEFVKSDIKKDGHHHIIFHVKNNPVIEQSKKIYGKNSMVCNWFMGIFAANGEMSLGVKNVKLVEKKCFCEGYPFCIWESHW